MKLKLGSLRRISAAKGATDTRKLALDLMVKALELLDKDPSISPLIGSQLQLAIDRLTYAEPEDTGTWRTIASTV